MVRKFFCLISVCICALSAVSCAGRDAKDAKDVKDTADDGKLKIIATVFPAYDFAREITGEYAHVTMLLPPGGEVHGFEPTPTEMLEIADCDLFIYNGGESDEWVETLLSGDEYEGLSTLRMMDCVPTLSEETTDGMEHDRAHAHEHEHGHENGHEHEADEHVWTSPKNAILISEGICKALCEKDAENANAYRAKFEMLRIRLSAIDAEIRNIAEEAENRTLIFADRFPMRYFAEEYGFDCYAAFPGCSSQSEPSVPTLIFLIDKARAEGVSAVFSMEFSDGRMAQTVCDETGAASYTLHSCHSVSADDFESGVTYCDLMQKNARTLRRALGVE